MHALLWIMKWAIKFVWVGFAAWVVAILLLLYRSLIRDAKHR